MQELTFVTRDLDGEVDNITAVAMFDKAWHDDAICNAIRNGIVAATGLELDELDMDEDGEVTRNGDVITVLWTASNGQQSETTLTF